MMAAGSTYLYDFGALGFGASCGEGEWKNFQSE